MNRRYFLGLQLLTTALAVSCSPQKDNKEVSTVEKEHFCLNEQLKKTTEILPAEERQITEQITLTGKIEYNENDLVVFRSLLEGSVEQVGFELGDHVRKGQVLATVRSSQVQELYQEKRNRENQIQLFEQQLVTRKEMLKDGLYSAPELLQLQHELDQARIELDRVVQSLALYRAAGSQAFQILAPKDGYIVQKAISVGQNIISDSDPLFSISDLNEVWAMVNIFASNLRYIKEGDPVKVKTIAYPDQVYEGKIDKIYNVFDDNEHVLKARVVLKNSALRLMPGLSADIIIDKESNKGKAFAIPNKAIVFHNNQEYVVVYKDDCTLNTKRITKLGANETYTFIQEKLTPDEQVVSTNGLLIYEQLSK